MSGHRRAPISRGWSEAGYGGVGPNFLPWVVGVALLLCAAGLVWEARSGGFRDMDESSGGERADWPGFVWVSAGLLANAALAGPEARFRYPIDPLIAVLAFGGIVWLVQRAWTTARRPRTMPSQAGSRPDAATA